MSDIVLYNLDILGIEGMVKKDRYVRFRLPKHTTLTVWIRNKKLLEALAKVMIDE